jgi:site-specific DNA-cytosine methylase
VPVSIAVNQDFSTGEDIAQPITGSNGQPGTIAVPVAFDWKTDGSDRARPNISTEHTSTLGTTKQDAVMVPPPDADAYRPDAEQWQHGGVDPYSGTLTATAVRRLTPTECERLQGFPDGWTATSPRVRWWRWKQRDRRDLHPQARCPGCPPRVRRAAR